MIGRCSSYVTPDGHVAPIDNDMLATFEEMKKSYSAQGKRCILLARKIVPGGTVKSAPETGQYEMEMTALASSGLTIVGLVAIVDPLRPEIPEVMSTLRGAGIRIAMVSNCVTMKIEYCVDAF